jgi:hypothetical protein
MRNVFIAAMACVLALPALAKDNDRPGRMNSRQAVAACEADAGSFTGDQRAAFMEKCLAKRERSSARSSRCRQEAQGMRSDERRRYLSACLRAERPLKGSPSQP